VRDVSRLSGAHAIVGQHGRTEQILDGATADGRPQLPRDDLDFRLRHDFRSAFSDKLDDAL
jgi:hypothetical protein